MNQVLISFNPDDEQKRLLDALKQGLISYIRTVGSTFKSHVLQTASSSTASQQQLTQLNADLQWLLNQSNDLFNFPNLVLADLALATELLSHLRSLVESFTLYKIPLPTDHKLLKLICHYLRLSKAIIFLHKSFYKRNEEFLKLSDELIVQAGKCLIPFSENSSEEFRAMESLVDFHKDNYKENSDNPPRKPKSYRLKYEWIKLAENYGTACAKIYLKWLVGHNINAQDIFEFLPGRNTFDLIYEDPLSGLLYVIEAKGGSSKPGSRKNERNQLVYQGTLDYLYLIAVKMEKSKRAKDSNLRRSYGEKVLKALVDGRVVYLGVSGRYNLNFSESPNKPIFGPKLLFNKYLQK